MIERLSMDGEYSPLENAIHLNRYELTRQYCEGKTILDISCGEGYGTYLMSECGAKEVIGIDISEEAIKSANKHFKKNNLKYLIQDATDLKDLKDNTFDMIVSFETFEHIENNKEYLKEIKRVAKENAIIIISCPNDYYYYPKDDESNPYHIRKYTFEEFKRFTENVLGSNAQYMLGMETMGYTNIIFEQEKEINSNVEISKPHLSIESKKISNGKTITADNCNYYIGLWNVETIKENNVIFPYMYTDWKDSIGILEKDRNDLSKLVNELKNEINLLDKDKVMLKEKLKESEEKLKESEEKLKESKEKIIMLDSKIKELEDENSMLERRINDLETEISKIKEQNKKLYRENQQIKETNKILFAQNEEVRQFSYKHYCDYLSVKEQLDAILNSRSYRWTRKLVKLLRMVKKNER